MCHDLFQSFLARSTYWNDLLALTMCAVNHRHLSLTATCQSPSPVTHRHVSITVTCQSPSPVTHRLPCSPVDPAGHGGVIGGGAGVPHEDTDAAQQAAGRADRGQPRPEGNYWLHPTTRAKLITTGGSPAQRVTTDYTPPHGQNS